MQYANATSIDPVSVLDPTTGQQLPPINFYLDVLPYYSGREDMPAGFRPYVEPCKHIWTWYCKQCLRKQPWTEYDMSASGWPQPICRACKVRIDSIVADTRSSRINGADGGHRGRRFRQKLRNKEFRKPSDSETFAKVVLGELGGPNGLAEMVHRVANMPQMTDLYELRRVQLFAAAVRCMEAAVSMELEERKIEAMQESLKQKSLSKFSEEDLKNALGPLVLNTLKKRPEVAIKALRDDGYVVEKNPQNLAKAVKRKDQRFQKSVLRELMK